MKVRHKFSKPIIIIIIVIIIIIIYFNASKFQLCIL